MRIYANDDGVGFLREVSAVRWVVNFIHTKNPHIARSTVTFTTFSR